MLRKPHDRNPTAMIIPLMQQAEEILPLEHKGTRFESHSHGSGQQALRVEPNSLERDGGYRMVGHVHEGHEGIEARPQLEDSAAHASKCPLHPGAAARTCRLRMLRQHRHQSLLQINQYNQLSINHCCSVKGVHPVCQLCTVTMNIYLHRLPSIVHA